MKPVELELRASLFAQLAALDDAGVAAAAACDAVAGSGGAPFAEAARRTARALAAGADLATAGRRTGLFSALEADLVAAYAATGSLTRLFRHLADSYRAAADRARRLRNRLLMPAAVLILAVAIAPLPRLVAGELSAGGYLLRIIGALLLGWLILAALVHVPGWLAGPRAPTGFGDRVAALNLRWPVLGALNRRRQALRFLDAFALLLDGGLPAADAVTRAARTVTNRVIADELAACAAPLAAGASVAATLGECRCLDAEAIALLHSGEGSGRLADTLLRYAETERARLGEAEDRLATWTPRLVYLLVLLWLAGRFI